jgi:hypothetical protein
MSKCFEFSMTIPHFEYISFNSNDDFKRHFKERLAYELAKMLIESDKTTFTHTPDPNGYGATLKARVNIEL